MSGPALKQKSAHRAIHEAALGEADELTTLLKKMKKNDENKTRLLEVAYVLVEHWETRTLAHAAEEEKGLYVQWVERDPALSTKVNELKQEHQLMRSLIEEIKTFLPDTGVTESVLSRFETLLLVNQHHNRKEENQLVAMTEAK
ncbi:MAG TPA: hemerythrin domain-containing protein [Bacillales bacterium]|nr:hemerythrin domain-containing protein [Bacillales bacterium]